MAGRVIDHLITIVETQYRGEQMREALDDLRKLRQEADRTEREADIKPRVDRRGVRRLESDLKDVQDEARKAEREIDQLGSGVRGLDFDLKQLGSGLNNFGNQLRGALPGLAGTVLPAAAVGGTAMAAGSWAMQQAMTESQLRQAAVMAHADEVFGMTPDELVSYTRQLAGGTPFVTHAQMLELAEISGDRDLSPEQNLQILQTMGAYGALSGGTEMPNHEVSQIMVDLMGEGFTGEQMRNWMAWVDQQGGEMSDALGEMFEAGFLNWIKREGGGTTGLYEISNLVANLRGGWSESTQLIEGLEATLFEGNTESINKFLSLYSHTRPEGDRESVDLEMLLDDLKVRDLGTILGQMFRVAGTGDAPSLEEGFGNPALLNLLRPTFATEEAFAKYQASVEDLTNVNVSYAEIQAEAMAGVAGQLAEIEADFAEIKARLFSEENLAGIANALSTLNTLTDPTLSGAEKQEIMKTEAEQKSEVVLQAEIDKASAKLEATGLTPREARGVYNDLMVARVGRGEITRAEAREKQRSFNAMTRSIEERSSWAVYGEPDEVLLPDEDPYGVGQQQRPDAGLASGLYRHGDYLREGWADEGERASARRGRQSPRRRTSFNLAQEFDDIRARMVGAMPDMPTDDYQNPYRAATRYGERIVPSGDYTGIYGLETPYRRPDRGFAGNYNPFSGVTDPFGLDAWLRDSWRDDTPRMAFDAGADPRAARARPDFEGVYGAGAPFGGYPSAGVRNPYGPEAAAVMAWQRWRRSQWADDSPRMSFDPGAGLPTRGGTNPYGPIGAMPAWLGNYNMFAGRDDPFGLQAWLAQVAGQRDWDRAHRQAFDEGSDPWAARPGPDFEGVYGAGAPFGGYPSAGVRNPYGPIPAAVRALARWRRARWADDSPRMRFDAGFDYLHSALTDTPFSGAGGPMPRTDWLGNYNPFAGGNPFDLDRWIHGQQTDTPHSGEGTPWQNLSGHVQQRGGWLEGTLLGRLLDWLDRDKREPRQVTVNNTYDIQGGNPDDVRQVIEETQQAIWQTAGAQYDDALTAAY